MQLNEIFHQVANTEASAGLRDLAARSGLPEGQLIVIAVSRLVHDALHAGEEADRPAQEMVDGICVDLEFERHGKKVGKVTYLNESEDYLKRVEKRIADGVPLPHEDDDNLEGFLFFSLLPEESREQARAVSDPLEKRHLIASLIKKHLLD